MGSSAKDPALQTSGTRLRNLHPQVSLQSFLNSDHRKGELTRRSLDFGAHFVGAISIPKRRSRSILLPATGVLLVKLYVILVAQYVRRMSTYQGISPIAPSAFAPYATRRGITVVFVLTPNASSVAEKGIPGPFAANTQAPPVPRRSLRIALTP